MSSAPTAIAVIPARGGSKGVPGKNLLQIAGRSLLERAITCARDAATIDRVVVSTDDAAIAHAAADLGAEVVDRPAELATDTAPTPPAVLHALDVVASTDDIVVLLQPPAPLRRGADVDRVVALLGSDDQLASVASVYEVGDAHPARMYHLVDGVLRPLEPTLERVRRQDLPPVYHRNGAIYATRTDVLRRTGELIVEPTSGYVMDSRWTVNIDTPADVALAEVVVSEWDRGHS
ncbi:MAG: acylneuraminate cytidylyltransferase family protein [Actinomycetota bacterium]